MDSGERWRVNGYTATKACMKANTAAASQPANRINNDMEWTVDTCELCFRTSFLYASNGCVWLISTNWLPRKLQTKIAFPLTKYAENNIRQLQIKKKKEKKLIECLVLCIFWWLIRCENMEYVFELKFSVIINLYEWCVYVFWISSDWKLYVGTLLFFDARNQIMSK